MIGGPPIPTPPRAVRTAPAYRPPALPSPFKPGAAPVVRGQGDDAPARPPVRIPTPEELTSAPTPAVRIPTPEELGLGEKMVTGDEALDWAMVERKLDAAGATSYGMEKAATGFRFTVQLPAGPVVGRGATKNEAMRNALRLIK
jgi:hypothetical protein